MPTIELTKARPDWQTVVSEKLTPTQRLVHLAMRHDSVMQNEIRAQLTKARQRAYNDEIAIQARRAGCSGQGEMTGGAALTELNELSKEDAEAFSRQYNLDLANAIIKIGTDTPRANRNVYAARLREWEGQRAQSRAGPLAMWAENTGRSLGFEHFIKNNGLEGTAHLEPTTAVCPVCNGWIARGEVSLRIASNNPPPYHQRCPHEWVTEPVKVDDCTDLWRG